MRAAGPEPARPVRPNPVITDLTGSYIDSLQVYFRGRYLSLADAIKCMYRDVDITLMYERQ